MTTMTVCERMLWVMIATSSIVTRTAMATPSPHIPFAVSHSPATRASLHETHGPRAPRVPDPEPYVGGATPVDGTRSIRSTNVLHGATTVGGPSEPTSVVSAHSHGAAAIDGRSVHSKIPR